MWSRTFWEMAWRRAREERHWRLGYHRTWDSPGELNTMLRRARAALKDRKENP
jgi:hypothetical protein